MRYLGLFQYKGSTIIIQDNGSGEGNFPFEYKVLNRGGFERSRTSYNTIDCCKVNAKFDIDELEERL